MKKSYSDVIKETSEFYEKDPKNLRSITKCPEYAITECLYLGPNGNRCAFSRVCENTERVNEILRNSEDSMASVVLTKHGFDILKEEYRHLKNTLFWDDIQCLHDKDFFWDLQKNKLSKAGLSNLEQLYKLYGY